MADTWKQDILNNLKIDDKYNKIPKILVAIIENPDGKCHWTESADYKELKAEILIFAKKHKVSKYIEIERFPGKNYIDIDYVVLEAAHLVLQHQKQRQEYRQLTQKRKPYCPTELTAHYYDDTREVVHVYSQDQLEQKQKTSSSGRSTPSFFPPAPSPTPETEKQEKPVQARQEAESDPPTQPESKNTFELKS